MSDATLVRHQIVAEQKSFWRNPLSAGFTFLFPIMFLVIFSSLNGGERLGPEFGHILFTEYYTPGIVAFGVIAACFTNLALNVCNQRDLGILKRKRSTPLPTWALVGGLLGNAVIVAIVLAFLTTAIGIVAYHNSGPRHLGWVVFVLVLGGAAFCAMGVAITILIPNADAAPAIVNFAVFPLLFLSGTFFPVTSDTINAISDVFPIRPFQQALFAAYDPSGFAEPPSAKHLLVLAAWGIAGAVVAVRFFRWERRSA